MANLLSKAEFTVSVSCQTRFHTTIAPAFVYESLVSVMGNVRVLNVFVIEYSLLLMYRFTSFFFLESKEGKCDHDSILFLRLFFMRVCLLKVVI